MRRLIIAVMTAFAVVAGLLGLAAPAQAVVGVPTVTVSNISADQLQSDVVVANPGNGTAISFVVFAFTDTGDNVSVAPDPGNVSYQLQPGQSANFHAEVMSAPAGASSYYFSLQPVLGDGEIARSDAISYTPSPPPTVDNVTIIGTPAVGSVLTCDGLMSPNVNYADRKWYNEAHTLLYESDASITYTVAASDAGHSITCELIVSDGVTSVSATSPAVSIPGGVPVITSVKVVGLVRVGSQPTCAVVATGASTTMYQWRKDGVDMPKQVDPKYNVLPADYGHVLSCRVSVSNGTNDAFATSAGVKVAIGPALVNKARPKLKSYIARVGVTLRLSYIGRFSPAATSYKVQWYKVLPKKGAKLVYIKGATRSYLKVSKSLRGYRLVLKVMAYRYGYKTGVAYTAATTIVR